MKGLLSYREDNKRLYVNEGSRWNALSTETEVSAHTFILLDSVLTMHPTADIYGGQLTISS